MRIVFTDDGNFLMFCLHGVVGSWAALWPIVDRAMGPINNLPWTYVTEAVHSQSMASKVD
jgi:hypothetical protein